MTEAIAIAAVVVTSNGMTSQRSEDGATWRYDVRAVAAPYVAVDGVLQPVTGRQLELLTTHADYPLTVATTLEYPAAENGGTPSTAQVAQAIAQWIGLQQSAIATAWVGRTVTVEVTSND
jgi:hypothetical protein